MKTWPRNTTRSKNRCWLKPLKPVNATPSKDPSHPGILVFGLQGQFCRVRIGTALLSSVLGLHYSPTEEEGKENEGVLEKGLLKWLLLLVREDLVKLLLYFMACQQEAPYPLLPP